MSSPSRGIYILGNDHVIDYLRALIFSLRRHEPDIPICLIPYNDQLRLCEQLCSEFKVILHRDPHFPELEKIGASIWADSPYSSHQLLFRRLCAFWGPFEHFLYLDADICALAPLTPLFETFEADGRDFLCFDVDHERVYKAGSFREQMQREHQSLGFNSGHFFSRRGALTLEDFIEFGKVARSQANAFQDRGDQGFLNLVIDLKGISKGRLNDTRPDLADKQWCEQKLVRHSGEYHLRNRRNGKASKLFLIHYSGYSLPGPHLPNRGLFYCNLARGRAWLVPLLLLRDHLRALKKKISASLAQLRIRLGALRHSAS